MTMKCNENEAPSQGPIQITCAVCGSKIVMFTDASIILENALDKPCARIYFICEHGHRFYILTSERKGQAFLHLKESF